MTLEKIVEEVRALAEKYPNAVYQHVDSWCHNLKGKVDNGPDCEGCLIGQAVRNAGFMFPPCCERDGARSLMYKLGFDKDHSLSRWLGNVQTVQDGGHTWGVAVSVADTQERVNA